MVPASLSASTERSLTSALRSLSASERMVIARRPPDETQCLDHRDPDPYVLVGQTLPQNNHALSSADAPKPFGGFYADFRILIGEHGSQSEYAGPGRSLSFTQLGIY